MKPFHLTKASVIIVIQLLVLSFLTLSLGLKSREAASETYFLSEQDDSAPPGEEKEKDFIRWVDFTVPAEVRKRPSAWISTPVRLRSIWTGSSSWHF